MRTLKFQVDKQRLFKDPQTDFKNIVAGSVGYLEAEFKTTSDWSGCTLVAFFTGENDEKDYTPVIHGRCKIPSNVLKGKVFTVQLIGSKGDGYKVVSTREIVLQKMR